MSPQTRWLFDAVGNCVDHKGDGVANDLATGATILVRVLSRAQAIAVADTLRPQVESLYTLALAGDSAAAVAVADEIFTAPKEASDETRGSAVSEGDGEDDSQSRSFVFVAYYGSEYSHRSRLAGLARVAYRAFFDAIVGSPLVVDLERSVEQQEALQLALFHSTQSVGEALTTALLIEKREKIALSNKRTEGEVVVPTSQLFWRGLFNATTFTRQLFAANGFYEELSRIEMSKCVTTATDGENSGDVHDPTFPAELDVKALDLSDHAALAAVYEMLRFVFGPDPPSFDAWKLHYVQQPRFAPELSFVVWDRATGAPIATALVERLADGEGGGDDELGPLYATHSKLQARTRAVESGTRHEAEGQDEGVTNKLSSSALVFPADFAERHESIARDATTAYVCGVATNAEFRGRGLARKLMTKIFQAAASSPPLQEVVLTVAARNTSAVRAYERAGMAEKRRYSSGFHVVKQISLALP